MILDFDGTLAQLDVDWAAIRSSLGVATVTELWSRPSWVWGPVRTAEVAAAERAVDGPAVPLVDAHAGAFAVLSANSGDAVHAWLARRPTLARRCLAVVGRERLGGPKHDPARFAAGFAACRAAVGGEPLVYVSDAAWELDLASALGASVVAVAR